MEMGASQGALLLAAALNLAGCGAPTDPGQTTTRIAFITKGAGNSFFDVTRKAALVAGDELRAGGKAVRVEIRDPQDQTAESQISALNAAVAEGYDAIAISVLDPERLTPAIDAASDQFVQVITFDSDAPESRRLTYFGSDNAAGAEELGRTLSTALKGVGKIGIMTTAKDSTSTVFADRLSGFESAIAATPGIEVVTTQYCSREAEAENGCLDLLEEATIENPDLAGWYLARGRALRQSNIEEAAPTWANAVRSGVVVVGFDAPEDALPSIRDGFARLVLSQKYFSWGYDVTYMAVDMVERGRVFGAFTNSDFHRVCANNVEQYAAMWASQDFRAKLRDCGDVADGE